MYGSTLFVQTYLSENLGSLRCIVFLSTQETDNQNPSICLRRISDITLLINYAKIDM